MNSRAGQTLPASPNAGQVPVRASSPDRTRSPSRQVVVAAALLAALGSPALAQDVLVVAPKEFQPALGEWKRHREGQGHRIVVREPGEDVGALVKFEHRAADGDLRYVLLLGDVEQVPCAYRPADAIAKYERDPRIATDGPWADVDDDGMPDLALGRLPADSVQEARSMLARVVAYETAGDFTVWRRRLNLVAGVGGFGEQQDLALEQLTRLFLNRKVPASVDVNFTFAKATSPYCPPPEEFADTFLERLNEGALITAYVGHGSERALDRLRVGDRQYTIFDVEHAARVDIPSGAPLVVFVACSTGSLDGRKDCLAEELMRRPRGPVAVIGSSRVSTPYSNAVFAAELLDRLYGDGDPIVGTILLDAKRAMTGNGGDDLMRRQIETLARSFYEKDDARRAVDRSEHTLLYHLFGDPTLRLARAASGKISVPEEITAGEKLTVKGTTDVAGKARVELVRRRDDAPPSRRKMEPAEAFRKTYEAANRRTVVRVEVDVEVGEFRVELPTDPDLRRGRYLVRFYVTGDSAACMAGTMVRVLGR